MLQERNGKNSRRSPLDIAIACGRCSPVGNVVLTFTTNRRIGGIARQRGADKAAKLPQQGLHLTLYSCGGGFAVIYSHRLQQFVKASIGVAEVQMAEDASQCSRRQDVSFCLRHGTEAINDLLKRLHQERKQPGGAVLIGASDFSRPCS